MGTGHAHNAFVLKRKYSQVYLNLQYIIEEQQRYQQPIREVRLKDQVAIDRHAELIHHRLAHIPSALQHS